MAGKTAVILGGGVGGLVVAKQLNRALKGEHRVVLVDRVAQHSFAPSFPWLMLRQRRPQQISRDIRRLIPSKETGEPYSARFPYCCPKVESQWQWAALSVKGLCYLALARDEARLVLGKASLKKRILLQVNYVATLNTLMIIAVHVPANVHVTAASGASF